MEILIGIFLFFHFANFVFGTIWDIAVAMELNKYSTWRNRHDED